MVPTNVIPFPDTRHSESFGVCPECGRSDGYLNLGIEHWFICREHNYRWLAGSNLFDSWKNQTVAQTQSAGVLLDGFAEIKPAASAFDVQARLRKQGRAQAG